MCVSAAGCAFDPHPRKGNMVLLTILLCLLFLHFMRVFVLFVKMADYFGRLFCARLTSQNRTIKTTFIDKKL